MAENVTREPMSELLPLTCTAEFESVTLQTLAHFSSPLILIKPTNKDVFCLVALGLKDAYPRAVPTLFSLFQRQMMV